MALHAIEGLMGGGKTYTAVHHVLLDYLRNTDRPICTNLPLNVEQLLIVATRSLSERAKMRERITLLEEKVELLFNADGTPWMEEVEEKDGRQTRLVTRQKEACRLREFWYFTPPNAVILLDELGEIYNCRDYRSEPETLGYYVNQHRHYKDDLYLIFQCREDVTTQVRRKIQFLWQIKNSKFENISEAWWMRGLKWPVQFFIVSVYLTPKGADSRLTGIEPQEIFWVRPNKEGYRCYNSFSASAKLPGKALADENAASTDVNDTLAQRMKGFFRQSWRALCVGGFFLMLGIMAVRFVFGLVALSNTESLGKMGGKKVPAGAEQKSVVPAPVPADSPVSPVAAAPAKEKETKPDVEKIVLVTPRRVVTSLRAFEIGDACGAGRIVRFDRRGAHCEGGFVPFGELLLSSGRRASR